MCRGAARGQGRRRRRERTSRRTIVAGKMNVQLGVTVFTDSWVRVPSYGVFLLADTLLPSCLGYSPAKHTVGKRGRRRIWYMSLHEHTLDIVSGTF